MPTQVSIDTEYKGLLLVIIEDVNGSTILRQLICNCRSVELSEFVRAAFTYGRGDLISGEILKGLKPKWKVLRFSPEEEMLKIQEVQ